MDTRSEEAVSPWQWTLGTLQPKATKRLARGPRMLREPGGPPWGPRRERGSATPGLSAFGTGDGSISVASRPAWGHWSRQPQVTDIASPVCQELPGCQAHSEHFTRRADSMLMSSKWHVQGRQGLRAPWKVTWEAPVPCPGTPRAGGLSSHTFYSGISGAERTRRGWNRPSWTGACGCPACPRQRPRLPTRVCASEAAPQPWGPESRVWPSAFPASSARGTARPSQSLSPAAVHTPRGGPRLPDEGAGLAGLGGEELG